MRLIARGFAARATDAMPPDFFRCRYFFSLYFIMPMLYVAEDIYDISAFLHACRRTPEDVSSLPSPFFFDAA